ncbi:hypothetical protein OUZ56_001516 [Daphnia magna]|uniref:Uncharacterized protein n=1 Tax=Daphnia magna TaxID=35525 RepID=A0ABR0A2Y8_9CRUS|nr:hypothetical protein OUZ56_001516 [Daphnia magna]
MAFASHLSRRSNSFYTYNPSHLSELLGDSVAIYAIDLFLYLTWLQTFAGFSDVEKDVFELVLHSKM